MTLPQILVFLSFALSAFGSYSYIRDTLRGDTKPNRISWGLWAFAPLAGAYISYVSGAEPWTVIRGFAAGFFPLLILLASFLNPRSYWKLGWFDFLCAAISVGAFYLWLGMNSPKGAIIFLVIADLFASFPVIAKTWSNPETETGITYLLGVPIFLLNIPIITIWNIENCAFQIYLLLLNLTLALLTYRDKMARFLRLPAN